MAPLLDEAGDCWSYLIVGDVSFGVNSGFGFLGQSGHRKNAFNDFLARLMNAEILEKIEAVTSMIDCTMLREIKTILIFLNVFPSDRCACRRHERPKLASG